MCILYNWNSAIKKLPIFYQNKLSQYTQYTVLLINKTIMVEGKEIEQVEMENTLALSSKQR